MYLCRFLLCAKAALIAWRCTSKIRITLDSAGLVTLVVLGLNKALNLCCGVVSANHRL